MINIENRISLSKASKIIVKELVRQQKGLNSKSWDAISKNVKNEISKKLLYNQRAKCVYCERYFIGLKNEIDHFAHKGEYSQYTFVTTNLFYSCNYCNSLIKNQRPTIVGNANINYKINDFLIIHPYFHNPDKEIVFKDKDRVDFDWENCSKLGKDTITFWYWDEFVSTKIRAKTVLLERLEPLSTIEEITLIQEIIAYK